MERFQILQREWHLGAVLMETLTNPKQSYKINAGCFGVLHILFGGGDCLQTKPNKFESGEQLIGLWSQFCDDIIACGFDRVPTQTAFCRWLADNFEQTDRKTIYNSLNKIFPNIKRDFEQIQSDTIMQGGMLGKYNPTMSIFGLKNWCGWSDTGKRMGYGDDADKKDDPLTKALKEEAELMDNAD